MYKISMHNHSLFSDGKMEVEEMIKLAIQKGFTHFGITDHVHTIGYEEQSLKKEEYFSYIEKVNALKEKYKDDISIFVGIEGEYYSNHGLLDSEISKEVRDKLDYVLGSVHCIYHDGKPYSIDYLCSLFRQLCEEVFSGDYKKLVIAYYEAYIDMLYALKPEVAGHVDIIKKNNIDDVLFDEKADWYVDITDKVLEAINDVGAIMELNTGGACKHGFRCFYPGEDLLNRAVAKGVKFTIGSDTHFEEMMDSLYDLGVKRLKKAGVEELYTYSNENKEFFSFKI